MARLTISLFGGFEVVLAGTPIVDFEYDKVRALLAYLAVESERPHRREVLAGLLWPDQPERKARHSLSQTLFSLRRTIGDRQAVPPFLLITPQTLQFNSAGDFELDAIRFTTLLAACREHRHDQPITCESCLGRFQQAVTLYRGSFLEGFSVADSQSFEEWTILNRERFQRLAIEALDQLTDSFEALGQYEEALVYAWLQAELNPWRETVHQQLMRLLAVSGQKEAALVQFDACRQTLHAELGLEPAEETIALANAIRQGTLETVGAGGYSPAVTRLPRVIPHNLPPQPTPFIGREEELAQISAYLTEPDCRLLSLVGPGGIGKTRLAVQAAGQILAARVFPHGVYFVPLASVDNPDFLVPAIADSIGFSFHGPQSPNAQLLNFLHSRHLLLILDNFEQLLAGVEVLVEILQAAEAVKLLITSRQRLNLRGEWLLDVRGLPYPPPDQADVASEETYRAVQLFVQSASRLKVDFSLSSSNERSISCICQLVEGMPLGIELAASWVRTLSCRQIVQEMARGLDVLTTSLRDMPAQHRSIRVVFEHSWQLLPEQERQLFRQMSVFRGGFRKRAAEQVTGASLPTLSALVDKTFLRRTDDGRYDMHELLRQFAAEKLEELPAEKQEVQDRHCHYYAAFLQHREMALTGPRQKESLAEITTEIENIRAAWRWAITHNKIEQIDSLVNGLFRFYFRRSWYQEGQKTFGQAAGQLEETVGLAGNDRLLLLGKLLARQGVCCNYLASYSEGMALLWQGLALLRQLGPAARSETAFALMFLGDGAWDSGEYSQAKELLQESIDIYRETGDQWGLAFSLFMLDAVAYALGDYPEAMKLAQESLATFTRLGDQWGIAFAQNDMGLIAYFMGRYGEAQRCLQESVSISEENGDTWVLLCALNNLARVTLALGHYAAAKELLQRHKAILAEFNLGGYDIRYLGLLSQLARAQGDYQAARKLGQESLTSAKAINFRRAIGMALNNLGYLACLEGEYLEAEQLLQESLSLRREVGYRRGVAESLGCLGKVAVAQGKLQAAQEYFHQALQIAVDIQARAIVLNILIGIAGLLVKAADVDRAATLLILVSEHPSSEQETKDRAIRLLAELGVDLSSPATVSQDNDLSSTLEGVAATLLETGTDIVVSSGLR